MRKVTKILAKVLSATVMLLIILPLLFSIAISLPFVQRYAVERLSHAASQKIGARVEVGAVRFTMMQNLVVEDFMVEDLGGDTMIYAPTVSAHIAYFSPLGKSITISEVKAQNAKLFLRESADSVMNIKQIVDRITNPEKEKIFKTTISNIELENFAFSLTRLQPKLPSYGVDLGDISIAGINAKGSDFVSQSGVTQLQINEFSGRERSGLFIKSFSGDLVTYTGVVDLSEVRATTSSTQLNIPRLRLEAESWDLYKNFEANVSVELSSQYSRLSSQDVAYFAPALQGKEFEVYRVNASFNGTIDNLEAQIDNLSFGRGSSLKGSGTVLNIKEPLAAQFDLDIKRLETNLRDIESTMEGFSVAPMGAKAREIVGNLGNVTIASTVVGAADKMELNTSLSSKLGYASYVGTLEGLTGQLTTAGTLKSRNLNIGGLISNKAIGSTSLTSKVYFKQRAEAFDAKIEGEISSFAYNSCDYTGITVEATSDGEIIEGRANSSDSKFDFDLSTLLHIGQMKHYDVTLRVNRADLQAMRVNTRDSISRISGSLRVNLGGNSLDELSGSVVARNLNYVYNEESIYAPSISVTARNNEETKYVDLHSDFVDMTFNSKSSFSTLFTYLKDGLRAYIPMLYTTPTERQQRRRVTLADNYSTLKIDIKEFSSIANAISSGLDIADNSSFNLMVNPYSERFALRLESDYIQYNKFAATQLNINAANDNDSLSMYATAADIFMGRTSFSAYTLTAGARDNIVELSTGFRDLPTETSATLGMQVRFDAPKVANITLRPSNLTLKDDVWMIGARQIVSAEHNQLNIDQFEMVNGSQKLTLNGAISNDPADSLMLEFTNYDISMITSVINDLGYHVNGVSNGFINMRELLTSPRIVADVRLDSVDVNSIPSPALRLSAVWNATQNRAGIFVTNRQNQDTVVTGYYAPADKRYLAHLKVDSMHMGLIDPLLKTTIEGTKGYADVDVTLQGQEKKASLHGGIDVYDLSTKILFTQVDYNIPRAYITVDDNRLNSQAQMMYDSEGNSGRVTMNLSLDHLSNVSYSLRIVPENMMVLNTTEKDNELFYGKLFATGVATIAGDKRGVDMDITATSNANSSFFMPLSTKSALAKTDFITFVQPDKSTDEESSAINFRRAFINERKRNNSQASQRVNINMALHATPDLDFQLVIDPVVGDVIKAKGEGRLNLNIAPQENLFEMYGDYNITEGNYLFTLLNPISKRFVIESGSTIQWTGDPIDPLLNIDAVYKVKTSLDPLINSTSEYSSESSSRSVPVDCIIHLGDRLAQPSVNFSIDVPTADTEQQAVIANTLIDQETISQQFFYLMFANSFIPVSSSYGSGLASSTTASTGFELLTNQLSNWLSSSNYNVVIRYRPESDLSSDEVDVGFSQSLIDNRLIIEVEGNYLADNKAAIGDSDLSNFMGEAYITWLIDKAGALRLKGFTQTIDRYDENQGLQETGIGIYFSESFENFQDLKRRIRDRFRRKRDNE